MQLDYAKLESRLELMSTNIGPESALSKDTKALPHKDLSRTLRFSAKTLFKTNYAAQELVVRSWE